MADLKEKLSCLEKSIAALMIDPLDREAIEEAVRLWRRFDLLPKITKVYQVNIWNIDDDTYNVMTSCDKEIARKKFIEEVTDRFIEINLDNDEFFNEDEQDNDDRENKLRGIVLNNGAMDLLNHLFNIETSNSWEEPYFRIEFEEVKVV